MTFQRGNHSNHDLAAAGRKGKSRSPWARGMLHTPKSRDLRRQWEAEGTYPDIPMHGKPVPGCPQPDQGSIGEDE